MHFVPLALVAYFKAINDSLFFLDSYLVTTSHLRNCSGRGWFTVRKVRHVNPGFGGQRRGFSEGALRAWSHSRQSTDKQRGLCQAVQKVTAAEPQEGVRPQEEPHAGPPPLRWCVHCSASQKLLEQCEHQGGEALLALKHGGDDLGSDLRRKALTLPEA